MLSFLLLVGVAAANDGVPPAIRKQYQEAVQLLSQNKFGPANDLLNALALQNPRVPEIFASRCSAQLGLKHWSAAEADCKYTLALKKIPTALYGLAVSEDGQGKYASAISHYREFAAMPEAAAGLRKQAADRAALLTSRTDAVAPSPPAPSLPVAHSPPPPPVDAGRPDPIVKMQPLPANKRQTNFVPGIPDSNESIVYVYWADPIAPDIGLTLYVDKARIGELFNGRYFELRMKPGAHQVSLSDHAAPDLILSVELDEGDVQYVKAQTANDGDKTSFKPVVAGKPGKLELRANCELVFSKKL